MGDYILALDGKNTLLEVVGGKGRSLSEMTMAGLPVPGGFHISTATYREFVADNNLQARILEEAGKASGYDRSCIR